MVWVMLAAPVRCSTNSGLGGWEALAATRRASTLMELPVWFTLP